MKVETAIPQKLPDGTLADVTMFGDTDTGEVTIAWAAHWKDPPGFGDCGVFRSISFVLSEDLLPEFFYWWGYDLSQPYFNGDPS